MINYFKSKYYFKLKNGNKKFVLPFAAGFTLIELMVVVSIMVILATVLTINLAGQRDPRDIRNAENQLVSNIKLVQSNVLSSRNLDSGETVQYYLIKFDLSNPTQYTLEAIYNADSGSPKLRDIQTIKFPGSMRLASSSPVIIDRSPTLAVFDPSAGSSQYLQVPGSSGCALLVFSAPFGKVLFNDGCSLANSAIGNPSYTPIDTNLADNDDYGKILNFVSNTSCPDATNICHVSTDSIMTVKLTNDANTISKTITINGITGSVSFN